MATTTTTASQPGMVDVPLPAVRTGKDDFIGRLARSLIECDRMMKSYRTQRTRFIKSYAGPYYGHGLKERQPMPLEWRLVTVLLPYLAVDAESMVTARWDEEHDPFARLFSQRLDHVLREMEFNETMRLVTLDMLIGGLGITHTALAQSGRGNWAMDPGKAYVDRVSFQDYLWDTTAYRHQEFAFEGHVYSRTVEWCEEVGDFDMDAVQALVIRQQQAREDDARRVSGAEPKQVAPLKEQVLLCQVYLPDEAMLLDVAGNPQMVSKALRERSYEGPESGPYDHFRLADVPDNFMPVGAVSMVHDLAEVVNTLARKIKRQAERQKDVGVYSTGHEEAAEAVRMAPDGSMVGVPDRDQLGVISFGGVNDDNWQAVAWFREAFNLIAGNPELLGGAGPQSNTLGQDKMNLATATTTVGDWRQSSLNTRNRILGKVALYEWTDPLAREQYELALPSGVRIPMRWSPEFREGDFLDYNYRFSQYPRRNQDPDEQFNRTVGWLERVGIPLAQLGAAQGVQLDVMVAALATARQAGVDIGPWVFKQGMPAQAQGGAGGMSGTRQRGPDNRVVRRMPAKPEPVQSPADRAGVPQEVA